MINLKKSHFLVTSAIILGHEVRHGFLKPNPKTMLKLMGLKPPTNFTELQSLYGMMNYFRPFIPNFSYETASIKKLLSNSEEDIVWTQECTTAVHRVAHILE